MEYGGLARNRTGVQGFAVLCVTTPPRGLKSTGYQDNPLNSRIGSIWKAARLVKPFQRITQKIGFVLQKVLPHRVVGGSSPRCEPLSDRFKGKTPRLVLGLVRAKPAALPAPPELDLDLTPLAPDYRQIVGQNHKS